MGGICGVVNFNGKPIDQGVLKKMVGFIDYRGPDGIKYWIEGNVGLVNLAFNTTPESLLEKQPLAEDELVLTADARVDNRDYLISVLKENNQLSGNTHTDADLILASYKLWGKNCPKYIIGDYAFAIWDKSKEKLFIARDTMGLRPLFYAFHDNILYFASAVQPIAHALPQKPQLNIPLMWDFLHMVYNRWPCETIYEEVYRLTPAHSLTIRDKSINKDLYFIFGQEPKPDFHNDQEWIDGFNDLLDEILKNHLRSITPVGIWVSGGVDSSALACKTYHLRKENPNLSEIKLISGVFKKTPEVNEKPYFDTVAKYCDGTPIRHVVSDDKWAFCELGRDNGFPLDEPDIWELRGYTMGLMKATREEGCNVYLTGKGSDDLIGQAFYHMPIALKDIALKNLKHEINWFQEKGKSNLGNLFLRAYLLPLIPTDLTYKFGTFLSQKKISWLNNDYKAPKINYCNLKEDFMTPKSLDNYGLKAYQMLRSPVTMPESDLLGLMNSYAGIEYRHPYLDRRMIEFLIKIPSHLRSFNGVSRVLLRDSMKNKMPEKVRMRKSKGSIMQLYYQGFNKEQERINGIINNSELKKLFLINSTKLKNEFKLILNKKNDNSRFMGKYICLETWLQENL